MDTVREWQPGDVALVRNDFGIWNRAILQVQPGGRAWVYGVAHDQTSAEGAEVRPLVVIDPENREQVERLAVAYATVESARRGDEYRAWENRSAEAHGRIIDGLADALRAFANPTPPIEEPTGYGAVVEDADGQLWIHLEQGIWYCVKHGREDWAGVKAVRVLSEGVPAEAKS